jgi:glycosyltransferase involved in cell wall biosynthesis
MSETAPELHALPSPPSERTGWPWTKQSDPLPEAQPNGSPWPKISVVTPSYNQGQFIEETIRSVLLQGYPNLEYIVMDGGSSDETVEILERYDPWIDHWVSEPDEGQSDAVNKGFGQASGEILAWLNSDDYYAPGVLRIMAEAFASAGGDVGAVVGTGHKVNREGEIVYTPPSSDLTRNDFLNWMNGGNFMQPACFFRRGAWEKAGPLRCDLEYPMDVDLWLKMARACRFKRVDATIAYAYAHPGAKTTGERERVRMETILLIAEHGGDEIARREAMKLADEFAQTADELDQMRKKIHRLTSHPLYRFVRPFYRWFVQ